MRLTRWLAPAGLALLCACGSTPEAPITPEASHTTGPYATDTFVYVAQDDGTVLGFRVDAASGGLEQIGGAPLATGVSSLVVDPRGRFLYALEYASGAWVLRTFFVDRSAGALIPSGAVLRAGFSPRSVQPDPSGRFGYVLESRDSPTHPGVPPCLGPGVVHTYSIDGATGSLTTVAGGEAATATGPGDMAFGPAGRFAYVRCAGDPTILADFPCPVPGGISAYAVDAGSGAVSPLAGSPFAPAYLNSLRTTPSGAFAYVLMAADLAEEGASPKLRLVAYRIDSETGTPSEIASSAFPMGQYSRGLRAPILIDPRARFLYVPLQDELETPYLWAYALSSSGIPEMVDGSPFSMPFDYAAFEPTGRFVYASSDAGGIDAHSVDPRTGTLSPVPGFPVATSRPIRSLAIVPPVS